jgi:tetratricopeptide (TPR) repeat protein
VHAAAAPTQDVPSTAPAAQEAPRPAPAAPAAPEAAPGPADAPASPEPLHPVGQLGDVNARLEHLMMEAHVRMTVSDYGNAVKVYAAIVDLAPKVAAYRARLAFAMACWPRTAKQAEREFLEAIRLEPDNADLHYQFGVYYKAMKVRSRAISEMRTAVKLNPRHKQAREELEALSPKDSALTSLKNLFKQR